jgi:hypothetical protein
MAQQAQRKEQEERCTAPLQLADTAQSPSLIHASISVGELAMGDRREWRRAEASSVGDSASDALLPLSLWLDDDAEEGIDEEDEAASL